jgi:hypothetical protein
MFNVIGVGSVIAHYYGVTDALLAGDVTRLSFLIYFLFLGFSIQIGFVAYRYCKDQLSISTVKSQTGLAWFVSDALQYLGIIGTVLGFIHMLKQFFVLGIEGAAITQSLCEITTGMSTALYTTAVGLICALILKAQLFNLTSGRG